MPFKKGRSGNPKGRPPGTKDKAGKELRDRVRVLLENQFDRIVEDLESLEPRDRVNAWLKLLEYSIPKLQRSEIIQEPAEEPDFDYSNLTDEELGELTYLTAKKMLLEDRARGRANN